MSDPDVIANYYRRVIALTLLSHRNIGSRILVVLADEQYIIANHNIVADLRLCHNTIDTDTRIVTDGYLLASPNYRPMFYVDVLTATSKHPLATVPAYLLGDLATERARGTWQVSGEQIIQTKTESTLKYHDHDLIAISSQDGSTL